jgi:FlaG/FlaF family flagellin (archaellin)
MVTKRIATILTGAMVITLLAACGTDTEPTTETTQVVTETMPETVTESMPETAPETVPEIDIFATDNPTPITAKLGENVTLTVPTDGISNFRVDRDDPEILMPATDTKLKAGQGIPFEAQKVGTTRISVVVLDADGKPTDNKTVFEVTVTE